MSPYGDLQRVIISYVWFDFILFIYHSRVAGTLMSYRNTVICDYYYNAIKITIKWVTVGSPQTHCETEGITQMKHLDVIVDFPPHVSTFHWTAGYHGESAHHTPEPSTCTGVMKQLMPRLALKTRGSLLL